jgi:hypothetical protein
MSEKEAFDEGMAKLLKANPQIVRAAMEQEKQEREEERKAKRSSSVRAASSRDT